jgi:hypothetical protein
MTGCGRPRVRRCALCGTDIRALRSDARFCGRAHRTDASRIRRLLAGETVGPYETLHDYLNRSQKRANEA